MRSKIKPLFQGLPALFSGAGRKGMRVTGSSSQVVSPTASFSGKGVLPLFSCGIPPMGDSPP